MEFVADKLQAKRHSRLAQQPTANSQQPTANSQQPTANSQQPTANSQQPIIPTYRDTWSTNQQFIFSIFPAIITFFIYFPNSQYK